MGLKKAENQVKILLAETILSMCRNTLNYHAEICVEGLLGITLDNEEIFLVNINQTIKNQIDTPGKAASSKENLKRSRKEDVGSDTEPESSSNESESSSTKKRRKRVRRKKHKGEKGSGSENGELADVSANADQTLQSDETDRKFSQVNLEQTDGSEQYYENSNQTAGDDSYTEEGAPSSVNVTVKQEPPGGPESDDDLVFVKQEVDEFSMSQPSAHQFSNLSQVFQSSADMSLSQPSDMMSGAFFASPANNMSANAMQQPVPGPSGANTATKEENGQTAMSAVCQPSGYLDERLKAEEVPVLPHVSYAWSEANNLLTIPAMSEDTFESGCEPDNSLESPMVENQSTESEATVKSTSWGTRKFEEWLEGTTRVCDWATISASDLNELLCVFYTEVRPAESAKMTLTPTSMTCLRAAIRRHIMIDHQRDLDIINHREFNSSNRVFKERCKLYAVVTSHARKPPPVIEQVDLERLSEYFKWCRESPDVLIETVWFYLCYCFGKMARDIWANMTKSTFGIATDGKDRKFVYLDAMPSSSKKQDSSDKRMYGEGVDVFEFYLSKLHPGCERLFQHPSPTFRTDGIWFKGTPIGKNNIGTIIGNISHKAGLSKIYSTSAVGNASVRHTSRAGINPFASLLLPDRY